VSETLTDEQVEEILADGGTRYWPAGVRSLATELLALRKRVGELEGAHTKAIAEATAQFHRAQSAERNLAQRIGSTASPVFVASSPLPTPKEPS